MSAYKTKRALQASLAAQERWRPTEDKTQIRRDFAAAKLEDYVAKVVAQAPPLTDAQVHRIVSLLGGAA